MTKLRLEAVECFERDVRLRLPFRFGVITVTRSTQAVIRVAAEMDFAAMRKISAAPKWRIAPAHPEKAA